MFAPVCHVGSKENSASNGSALIRQFVQLNIAGSSAGSRISSVGDFRLVTGNLKTFDIISCV